MDMRRQRKYRKEVLTTREGTAPNNWVKIPDRVRPVWDMSDEQVASAAGIEVIPKVDAGLKTKGSKRKPKAKVQTDDSDGSSDPLESPEVDYDDLHPGK
jgi:hypothetical protein